MAKYSIVLNGIVINMADWDGETEWSPVEGDAISCPDEVSIGWLYDGSVFTNPNAPQPPLNSDLYKKEFEVLNKQYLADISPLSTAWGNAGLFDGVSEATKKSQLQSQATSVKSKYQSDVSALKTKYGV